jgi:succinate-semialdehyde dehydrogenase/glutarate-semialdehyde dehydrogenase
MVSQKMNSGSSYPTGAFINGQFIQANGPNFDVIDPGTGKAWISLKSCTEEHVEPAVQAAEVAFRSYKTLPPRARAQLLLKWDQLIREHKEEIAKILVLETGKPYKEAIAEVDYALTFSWWMVGEAERQHGSTINGASPENRFLTIKQPLGVVAALTPWNFPVALMVRKVATALAAGCTVVAKPSPETPISTLLLASLAKEAGFPDGCFNVLPCDIEHTPEIGKALCEHPVVQKVTFTGSTQIGKLLAKQCASTLKKLTLELGGNGPFIIFDDADVEKAVNSLMQCKFRHAGQTCVCAQRVFVQKSVYTQVADLLKQKIQSELKQGNGFDEAVNLGPLTTPRSIAKAEAHVQDAVNKGAKVVSGGKKKTDVDGFFFEPTLLTGMNDTMIISHEETFAPVLGMYSFETEEEVIKRANDTPMGLTSYFFTQDADRVWRILEALETGNVGINTGMTTSAEAPFGGWHDSGYGKEAGASYGINEYLKVKTATWKVDFGK